MVKSISFALFDAYRSGFYPQAAAMSGSCLLTATDLILEHYHCYPHIILNVAMTLFLPVSPFLLFFSMSLMSLNNRVRRILMVLLHCLFFLIISPHLIGRVEECITYYCYRWLSLLIGTQERGFGCYLVSICEHRYCSFYGNSTCPLTWLLQICFCHFLPHISLAIESKHRSIQSILVFDHKELANMILFSQTQPFYSSPRSLKT